MTCSSLLSSMPSSILPQLGPSGGLGSVGENAAQHSHQAAAEWTPGRGAFRLPALITGRVGIGAELTSAAMSCVRQPIALLVEPGVHHDRPGQSAVATSPGSPATSSL